MVSVFTSGQMVETTKVSILKITDRVLEFSPGLMEEDIKVLGKKAKCMVKALTGTQTVLKLKEYGLKAKEH